ncbi:MAG: entericidin A/B family lipoprotein [Thiogranum sp.]|nr:entericidin A/B family lipoprotein [Thiogranum sp.]
MRSFYLMILMAMFSLAGCNTIEGMGEDVEAGGKAVQEKADDVRN